MQCIGHRERTVLCLLFTLNPHISLSDAEFIAEALKKPGLRGIDILVYFNSLLQLTLNSPIMKPMVKDGQSRQAGLDRHRAQVIIEAHPVCAACETHRGLAHY